MNSVDQSSGARPLIVHLIPGTAAAGAEKQARYLIAGLRERGIWDVELAYFRPGFDHHEFANLDVPLRLIDSPRPVTLDWRRRARRLHGLYTTRQPAILHSWLDEANVIAALTVRRWSNTRLVISQRCAAGNYSGKPLLVRTLQAIRRRVDHAVTNSQGGVEFLHSLGYLPDRVSLIRNGISLGAAADGTRVEQLRGQGRDLLGLSPQQPTVGFVGRPNSAKDLPTLLTAMELVWRELPNARLVLVGPSTTDLKEMGLKAPKGVLALGWHDSAASLMPAFDLLALSSRTEGHSNAVDEALLTGIPVVTTNVGDHVELVRQAEGRVVPIARPDMLGASIVDLLRAPPPHEHVRAVATAGLSMGPVVEATGDLYERVLSQAPTGRRRRRAVL